MSSTLLRHVRSAQFIALGQDEGFQEGPESDTKGKTDT